MRILLFALALLSFSVGAQEYLPEVTLTWTAPTQTESGQPLEVGGYDILYREMSATEWTRVLVTDSTRTELVVSDLVAGDYEFSMAVYDAFGCYGQFNQPQQVTIRQTDKPPVIAMGVTQNQQELVDPVTTCTDDCTIVED